MTLSTEPMDVVRIVTLWGAFIDADLEGRDYEFESDPTVAEFEASRSLSLVAASINELCAAAVKQSGDPSRTARLCVRRGDG